MRKVIFSILFICICGCGKTTEPITPTLNWERVSNGLPNEFLYTRQIINQGNNLLCVYSTANNGVTVYRSKDSGYTWQPINTGMVYNGIEYVHGVNTLQVENNNIYAGVANGGIFLSNDNGEHWQEKNNGLSHVPVYSIATSENRMFIGTNVGVYFSANDGITWEKRTLGLPIGGVKVALFKETNSKTVYAAGSKTLYSSSDNGLTWYEITNRIEEYIGYDLKLFIDNKSVYILTNEKILISTDNGYQWKKLETNGRAVTGMSVISSNIFATFSDGLYLSKDNGNTWTNLGLSEYKSPFISLIGNSIFVASWNGVYKADLNDVK